MELTKEEAAKRSGGNRFFASVAEELRQDFMQEGQMFFQQGVKARWDIEWNSDIGGEALLLRVEAEGEEEEAALRPCMAGKEQGLSLSVGSWNAASYTIDLYGNRTSEFTALQVCRLACVALFGLENRRSY